MNIKTLKKQLLKIKKKLLKIKKKQKLIKKEIKTIKSKIIVNQVNLMNWEKKYSHLNQPK